MISIDDISKKVAKDNNLSEVEVTRVNRVQYKFLLHIMQSGTFEPVQLIYLGKFSKNKNYDENGRPRKNSRRLEKPNI